MSDIEKIKELEEKEQNLLKKIVDLEYNNYELKQELKYAKHELNRIRNILR